MKQAREKRPYRQVRRAESQAETRQRIVEAIVALHEEVGPARTTVSAVAERAGVERLTVYRHFPDEAAQFAACSAHWSSQHPPPDPQTWHAISEPSRRLRTGLRELYRFYRLGQPMLANILHDAPQLPDLQKVIAPFQLYMQQVAQVLADGWQPRTPRLFQAAVAHAIAFETWQSLAQQGLDDAEAADLLVMLVQGTAARAGAAAQRPPASPERIGQERDPWSDIPL